ncbi:hypothetical protein BDV36DRAFT_280860 [Aspergillus pseudocaelatus]|uniref:Glycosyltransferase family 28 N-terminal domain-containing protein n=1 Tax=Aspergillus pseudocaelatus TaxID=1825620 RepID=A0ABQ6WYA1_9EURO|nr:hypothetical protein BDV36DRAFT_280860 [Aspergillus pseudocaelatus]
MAAAAAASPDRPHEHGITTGDWPDEHLSPRRLSLGGGHAHVREQGLNTGVRVMDDGRLDIKFREHKPWLLNLIKHLERYPKPLREERRPSVMSTDGQDKFPLRLNVVIHVVGSRGDVQPFVALGKELQKHGHRVRLATHLAFREYINESGLEFFSIGGDPAELMAFMVNNPGLMPDMRTIRSGAIPKRRREMKAIFSGCWRSCFETGDGTGMHHIKEDPWSDTPDCNTQPFVADVIIANPPSFAHLSCAEKLGIPVNMMFTMPWSATQSFPHPLANIRARNTKPSVANFASYAIVEVMLWEGLGDLINRFRKRELGLDPLDAIRAPSIAHRLQIPYTYLWSPALLPKPQDWGENIDVCGFQFLESDTSYKPPDDLDAFLKAGDPPVYIGFGSIVVDNPAKLTEIVFEAVRLTGKRALVSKGWGNIGEGRAEVPEDVMLLGKVPHDWLFQHVSCVVHHGGAGTTAAGLVLGRPTVIVPFFGDQPFWGSIVARAGAGPHPVPYKQLTAEKLAEAINKALEPSTLEKAEEIGKAFINIWICAAYGALYVLPVRRYRSKQYDTNRDPRGPLSAGAEVLYGVVSDFISGFATVPTDLAGMLSKENRKRKRHHHHSHHIGSRDWVRSHCTAGLEQAKEQERERSSNEHGNGPSRQDRSESDDRSSVSESEVESESDSEYASAEEDQPDSSSADTVADDSDEAVNELDLERTLTRKRAKEQKTGAQEIIAETGYHTSKFAKQVLNFVIMLPTDLTLSLAKGFHNAPKLYHDTTVQRIPRVRNVKSGFRAAGTEFTEGFYYGVTGLLTQPARGFQKSGGRGLVKGVGKGVGGVFLKPAAGIWGLAGFPLDGLHKSLRNSLTKNKTKYILRSRLEQGIQEMCVASTEERAIVIRKWRELEKNHSQHQNGHAH